MIGLMVEEADQLTDTLKVDKISALVMISTPRMKKKIEEADIEDDCLGHLLTLGLKYSENITSNRNTKSSKKTDQSRWETCSR